MPITPITWFADTNQGPRAENQDAVLATNPTDSVRLNAKGVLLVLCDGVGGESGGQRASRLASQVAFNAFYADPSAPPQALQAAVEQANTAVQTEAANDASVKNMASTMVLINLVDNRLFTAHVGDSRAYLLREGALSALTKDHNWVSEQVERGLMTPEEARISTSRNIITRSLGAASNHSPDVMREPLLLQPGDRVLICTDGLHGVVSDQQIAAIMQKNPVPQRATAALIQAALANQTSDNISAIVLNYGAGAVAAAPVASGGTKILVPLLAAVVVLALVIIAVIAATSSGGVQTSNTPTPAQAQVTPQPGGADATAAVSEEPVPTVGAGTEQPTLEPGKPTVTPDLRNSPTPSPAPTRQPTNTPTPAPTNTPAPTAAPTSPPAQPTSPPPPPPTVRPTVPPTAVPPTAVPPTAVPPTAVPPTDVPPPTEAPTNPPPPPPENPGPPNPPPGDA